MEWHNAGTLPNATAEPSMHRVQIGDVAVLMANVDGEWLAVEDRCSHAGCAFSEDGEVVGGIIICNCHGAEFTMRSGAVVAAPARAPIRVFPVRTSHGRLEIGW